ncbi:MAG: ATP-binding cassette domain-containing protein [Candidatus Limivivens sp.]|nr:ATP-binding cassette domain-containing protein [Candidatus Limivivens sp.]
MKLELRNIQKSFSGKEVLHGISFSVESGRALGLLGRNGAGKTTTIRIIMDVFKANAGTITLDGRPFVPREHQIGYLPEERGLYPKKKVGEQLIYLAMLRGMDARAAKDSAHKWLKRLEVEEYFDRKLETLSKGNQQKVQLAQTLVCDPELVILDEPFSGLDPVNSQILKDVIQEVIARGKMVIFSSHQMGYVEEFCEDIVIIHHGDVVLNGNLDEIKKEKSRGRLQVSCRGLNSEALAGRLAKELSGMVAVEKILKDEVVVCLKEGSHANGMLRNMMDAGLELESFGRYEPSLNDIFVESAGDEA